MMDQRHSDLIPRRSSSFGHGLKRIRHVLLTLVISMAASVSLRADITSLSGATEITSLPHTISEPGVYFLSANFTLTGLYDNAITVSVGGVTIDLNGHTISNLSAGKGVQDSAIYAPDVSQLTVRNGVIRGFTYGVYAPGGGFGHLVENVRFTDTTFSAVSWDADGSIVRHCQAYKFGGSTLAWAPYGVAFYLLGANNSVQDCDVGEATSSDPATYPTEGVYFNYGGGCLAVGNRFNGVQVGILFDTQAAGKYRDNLCAASVATPYTGGIDAFNN